MSIYKFRKSFYFHIVRKFIAWHPVRHEKELYLTFDDGPEPDITSIILDQLDMYQAKGTFFCCGKNIMKYPELFHNIITKGHAVGNHTYNHINGLNTNTSEYVKDVENADQYVDSVLFRPPWGIITLREAYRLRHKKIVMWDVASGDTKKTISDPMSEWSHVKSGDVVLFHFSNELERNTRFLLPMFLQTFSDKGYIFQKIEV